MSRLHNRYAFSTLVSDHIRTQEVWYDIFIFEILFSINLIQEHTQIRSVS